MPYQNNESLPDNVKGVLPADAQSVWRSAFNSSLKNDPDEDKARKIAWGAVENAGYEKQDDGNWTKAANNSSDKPTHEFDARSVRVRP